MIKQVEASNQLTIKVAKVARQGNSALSCPLDILFVSSTDIRDPGL